MRRGSLLLQPLLILEHAHDAIETFLYCALELVDPAVKIEIVILARLESLASLRDFASNAMLAGGLTIALLLATVTFSTGEVYALSAGTISGRRGIC